MIVGDPEAVKG